MANLKDNQIFRVSLEDMFMVLGTNPDKQKDLNKLFVITVVDDVPGYSFHLFALRKDSRTNRSLLFDLIKYYVRSSSHQREMHEFGAYMALQSFAFKLTKCLL